MEKCKSKLNKIDINKLIYLNTILKINELISSQGFTIEGAKQKLESSISNNNAEDPTYSLLKKDIQKIIDVLDK